MAGNDQIGDAALQLTEKQIKQAMEIATKANGNRPADPSFVGSVLVALALNTNTMAAALK